MVVENLDVPISIRMKPSEAKLVKEAAVLENKRVSDFIRSLVVPASRRIKRKHNAV